MSMPDSPDAKPGTYVDLARRMDRMESAHESLAKEVGGLTTTIARVEMNQTHAEELGKLRYDSLVDSVNQIKSKMDLFIDRIEKVMSGEATTPQGRAGEKMVEDYLKWRADVDSDREDTETLKTQLRFLSRLVVVLTGGSVVTTGIVIWTLITGG